jgi:hypothetical protein
MYDGLEKVAKYFKDDDRIRFSVVDGGPHHNWGHTPRVSGLSVCEEEWVIMTGDDNYYFPVLVEEYIKAIKNNPSLNFLYCDMYHNYSQYVYEAANPKALGHKFLDIGNFVSRTKLAQQIPFQINRHNADGLFAEEYIKRFCTEPEQMHGLGRALYVHN